MKQVYIYAAGCTENLLDAQKYTDFLMLNGYVMTHLISEADIILFITCGVTSYVADECSDSFHEINQKKKNGAMIYVGGCLPVIEKNRFQSSETVKIFRTNKGDVKTLANALGLKKYIWSDLESGHSIFIGAGNDSKSRGAVATPVGRFQDLVQLEKKISFFFSQLDIEQPTYFRRITEDLYKDSYFIHVGRGCSGNCTYCAVKFVKGSIQSKSIESIMEEVKHGYEKGYNEFVLAGDDVGSYGLEVGFSFYDLMKSIHSLNLPIKFTVRNFEPFWLINHVEYMDKILEFGSIASICIPIESGDDEILSAMGRKYKSGQIIPIIRHFKQKYPNVLFSTHIMVGFPGETEEQFQKTIQYIKEEIFDFIRYSMYTDRPNTAASKIYKDDKLSQMQKKRRMMILEQIQNEILMEHSNKEIKRWYRQMETKLGEFMCYDDRRINTEN